MDYKTNLMDYSALFSTSALITFPFKKQNTSISSCNFVANFCPFQSLT